MIFFSTDYVFDGRRGPHDDDEEPRPTTEYGRQKVAVEKALPSLAENDSILRLEQDIRPRQGRRHHYWMTSPPTWRQVA